jgi:hypothetical protein
LHSTTFFSILGIDSQSSNTTSILQTTASADPPLLQTKFFDGTLGEGGCGYQILASVDHGIEETKIWSISIFVQDRTNNALIPPSYQAHADIRVGYTYFSAGGRLRVVTADGYAATGITGRPFRMMIMYQD